MRPALLASLLLLLSSCASTSAGQALVGVATGATGAALSVSQGACVAACPPGTTCNSQTGYCDTLPCRGACGPGESCEAKGKGSVCVPTGSRQALEIHDPK